LSFFYKVNFFYSLFIEKRGKLIEAKYLFIHEEKLKEIDAIFLKRGIFSNYLCKKFRKHLGFKNIYLVK
jgi:hypothetical protein